MIGYITMITGGTSMDYTEAFEQIDIFRIHLIEEEKSTLTVQKYIRDITRLFAYLSSEKTLTKQCIIKYKEELMKSYTSVSINSMLVAINCFFTFINQPGYRVKLLKIQKRTCIEKERELTKKDYARLLKAAQDTHNERMYLLLQTICATGIRVSEHRFITVEAVKSRKAAVQNKGKLRYIFFPSRLRKQLLAYCKRKKITSGSVFVTNSGRPLDRSNIWKAMKKLCLHANVSNNKVFPHNLRHLFAFTFYSMEKDVVRLADILGHSSIETTRVFTMTSFQEYEKTLSRMDLVRLC